MALLRANDTGVDMTFTSDRSSRALTFTEQTPTMLVGDYRSTGQPGYVIRFNGVNLGGDIMSGPFTGPDAVTGTLTDLRETLNGTRVLEVTGFSVPALSLRSSITSRSLSDVTELVLREDDMVQGGAGDDVLRSGRGFNTILGGRGYDTVVIDAPRSATLSYRFHDEAVVFQFPPYNTKDLLAGIEAVRFLDGIVPQSALEAARPFQYLATYSDLAATFGTDEMAGWRHFAGTGLVEGRSARFSGLSYVASYGDLRAAYGLDAEAGARHFLVGGRAEGREVTFDAGQYLAANSDLRAAFGTDLERGTSHYIQTGVAEGRATSFDGLRYIASYGDLIRILPKTIGAGALHFISSGANEGRSITFDTLRYVASNRDLIQAFGANEARGLDHWLGKGFSENRSATAFDPARYLDNYADLRAAFGTDQRAATLHWIGTGAAEGRTA